jgi:hypothetical protein
MPGLSGTKVGGGVGAELPEPLLAADGALGEEREELYSNAPSCVCLSSLLCQRGFQIGA